MTIAYTAERIGPDTIAVQWLAVPNTEDGAPYAVFPGADRSVQVTGTFGAGGTLVIEGTNGPDPATAVWATLTDPQGNALSFTSARLEQVAEYTRWVRPRVTAGDGTTSLNVHMIAGG